MIPLRRSAHSPLERTALVISLAFLVAASSLAFQDIPFRVTRGSDGLVNVKPGDRLTIAFRLQSSSGGPLSLTPRISVPGGWRVLLPPKPFSVPPGAAEIRTLSLSVPKTAPAGSYSIVYQVSATTNPAERSADSVQVIVQALRGVDLALLESPDFIPAGSEIVSRFRVSNTGNTPGLLVFETVSNAGRAVLSDSAGLSLEAGEAKEIEVRLSTTRSDRVQPQHVLQLETRFADHPEVAARASTLVEVIPVPLDGMIRYNEFPGRVTGIVAGEEDRAGAQVEVTGRGTPFDSSTDELELLLRGPDNQPNSTLGKRDEYRITYDSPEKRFRILLGDQTYRLTPLTEFGRYSFGAGLEGSIDALSGTVYAHQTRLASPRENQLGAAAMYELLPWAGLGANYLRKSGAVSANIAGLRSILRPGMDHTVDIEFAQSNSNGIADPGFAARAYGRWPWLVYDVQVIRAEPNFMGYFKDLQFFSAGATVMPFADFRFEGNVRMDDRNIDENPAQPYAPSERFYLAGLGFRSFATLYFRSLSQYDRLSGNAYDRREDIAQLRLSWAVPRVSLVSLLEYGGKQDNVLDRSTPYWKASLYSNYFPTLLLRLGAWLEYTSERDLRVDAKLNRASGGASVGYTFWRSTQAMVLFYASRTESFYRATNMFVEGLVNHTFPWGHLVQGRARYSYFDPAITRYVFAFSLEYGIPLSVPLARKRDIGRVSGRVMDAETGAGVAGALLRADGTAALTDETGAFMFPGLAPGEYPVEINRSSIGLDRRPAQAGLPVMTVVGGEVGSLDIAIVRSGSIIGRIAGYGYRDDAKSSDTLLVDKGGLAGTVVELRGTDVRLRQLSNSRGEFRFPDLSPGKFVIQIQPESVPSLYRLNPDSAVVVVAPGEERSVLFTAIERKRVVRVVQQGEVRVERAPAAAAWPLAVVSDRFQNECLLLPVPGGSGYKVQVSSWQTQAKAEAVGLWASSVSGYSSSVERITVSGGGVRYAVRMAKVSDAEEAQRLCTMLAELDRSRGSTLPAVSSGERPMTVEHPQSDTTTVKPGIRFLSPDRVKELLRRSGGKKK